MRALRQFKLIKPWDFCPSSWEGGSLFPAEHESENSGASIFHGRRKAHLRMEPTEMRQSQEMERRWDLMTFFEPLDSDIPEAFWAFQVHEPVSSLFV